MKLEKKRAISVATYRISWSRKLLFIGVVAGLTLGLCEAALRLRAWLRFGTAATEIRDAMLVRDEEAGLWVPRPGYEVKGAKIHIKINSLGFRGDEFSKEKPPGTFRIIALGASTTFSAEASSNDAIWTALLQKKLQGAYSDAELKSSTPQSPDMSPTTISRISGAGYCRWTRISSSITRPTTRSSATRESSRSARA
jgi:hypothetical protein